jgi:glycosyltransferase 2 family protein
MIRLLFRLAVAVVAMALLIRRVDLAAVRDALVATPPRTLVAATLAAFAANLVIAYRLRVLLTAQGVAVRTSQTFAINMAAFFYNLFLPVGGVGVAALRLHRISRVAGGRFTAALAAMLCDRLAAIPTIGVIGLVCWMLDPHAKPAGGIVVLLIGSSMIVALLAPRVVPRRVRRFARELQSAGAGTWWSAALVRVGNALGAVARLPAGVIVHILAISVAAQILGIVMFMAIGDGLGLPISPLSMGWVRSVVVLITILPISVAGFGVREGVLIFVLGVFGVPAHDALAVSILIFATSVLAPGLAGAVVEGVWWLRGAHG